MKFLIIRRDNIGDLACTTPLIRALRSRYPDSHIAALVNSYNEPVLEGSPDVDAVYSYTKAKHRRPGQSVLGVYWNRYRLFRRLRRERFDYAIIASTGFLPKSLSLARQMKAKHIVGFVEGDHPANRFIDIAIPYKKPFQMHLVEELEALARPFSIVGPLPAMRVVADPQLAEAARKTLAARGVEGEGPLIGIHISARKVPQRWPAERFVALMRRLHERHSARFILFWSPGDENNPLHPGDDQKAAAIMTGIDKLPVLAFPTHTLRELIAGLSLTDQVICSDGGAMHLAAALAKPIVCFFGNSDASVWYPWGVKHELLQKESRDVNDISVEETLAAYERLVSRSEA
jgi:ADP-heptose:LPS heptosyltransferase